MRKAARGETQEQLYQVREGFAISDPDGMPRVYPANALIRADDPLVQTHAALLKPASSSAIEQATAAPGERRDLILPSGQPLSVVTQHRTGHAHSQAVVETEGDDMAPTRGGIPPEDPRSPASPFAPAQPAAGVVADDVPDSQNLAGAPKAADAQVDTQAYTQTATDPSAGAGPIPAGQETQEGETAEDARQVPEGDPTKAQEEGSSDEEPADTGSGETGEYDPADYSVRQVNSYLDSADAQERERVLQAERDGKNRQGIVG